MTTTSITKPSREYEFDHMQLGTVRVVRAQVKTGRNDPCPCGSGKKYKRCHLPLEGR